MMVYKGRVNIQKGNAGKLTYFYVNVGVICVLLVLYVLQFLSKEAEKNL